MQTGTRCISLILFFGCALFVIATSPASAQRNMTKADVDKLVMELSNWGRWGKDDQLGTLNLITTDKRKASAKLVKLGLSVSLARQAEEVEAADNPSPFEQKMLPIVNDTWAVDQYRVDYHGYAHTHMDSLCHLFFRGKMYNGFSRDEVTETGANRLSIDNIKGGIFTRGILIDIPHLRGVKYLEPGSPIYPEELDAWENRAGLKVGPGDVVFIRTGRWARRADKGPWAIEQGLAGLHGSCAKWLRKRDIAMLGSDSASDVIPSQIPGVSHPIHLLTLHAMGVHIFDNCDLEEVAKTGAKLKRWDFLLTAAPIPVTGGTGSPLNPIATF